MILLSMLLSTGVIAIIASVVQIPLGHRLKRLERRAETNAQAQKQITALQLTLKELKEEQTSLRLTLQELSKQNRSLQHNLRTLQEEAEKEPTVSADSTDPSIDQIVEKNYSADANERDEERRPAAYRAYEDDLLLSQSMGSKKEELTEQPSATETDSNADNLPTFARFTLITQENVDYFAPLFDPLFFQHFSKAIKAQKSARPIEKPIETPKVESRALLPPESTEKSIEEMPQSLPLESRDAPLMTKSITATKREEAVESRSTAAKETAETLSKRDPAEMAPQSSEKKAVQPAASMVAEPSETVLLVRSYITKFYQWFFRENPLVKIGIVILFFGFAFLLKLAVEQGFFPIEMRLLSTAAISAGLFAFGWKLRHKSREYALSLQGAGLGGLYFILYAANKIFALLPNPTLSLIGMLLICASIIFLGMLQRAQTLAFIALLGGFLAPPLMSTGGGTFLQLYTFYTLLSVTIFALTMRYSWQFLHILGFVMLFGVTTLIGFADSFMGYPLGNYDESQLMGTLLLLPINLFIYGIGILLLNRKHHERNEILFNGKYTYHFNTSLLLGTPLVGFGLLYLLLNPYPYGLAYASAIYGVAYLLIAWLTKRVTSVNFESERFFFTTLGLGFLTLAIPLGYTLEVTAIIWAIEGALFLLINHREIPRTTYSMGTGLILFSAIHTLYLWISGDSIEASTFFINALALGIAAWRWRVAESSDFVGFLKQLRRDQHSISHSFLTVGFLFWLIGLYYSATKTPFLQLNWHGFPSAYFMMLALLFISGIIALQLRQFFQWRAFEQIESALLGLSISGTVGLMIWLEGDLVATGSYNLIWLLLATWLLLLIRNLTSIQHRALESITILSYAWLLWIGNQFLISLLPTAYMIDITAILWTLEGVALLSINHRRQSSSTFVVGSALTVTSGIYAIVLAGLGNGFLTLFPAIINASAIMITAWFWEFRRAPLTERYFHFLSTRRLIIPNYLHTLGYALLLITLILVSTQSWLLSNNGIYHSFRFNLLGLGALLGMGAIVLRQLIGWNRLRYLDLTLMVAGLLLTLHLLLEPLLSPLSQAGSYNVAWIIVIGWISYLLLDAVKTQFENCDQLLTYGLIWGLLLGNQFLLDWIEPAYVMMLESILLLLITQRSIAIGSRYLGTLFALLAWPLYWLTQQMLGINDGLTYHLSLILLTLPLLVALHQLRFHPDAWIKDRASWGESLQTLLLLLFAGYLYYSFTLIGRWISGDYQHFITLFFIAIISAGAYLIATKRVWREFNHLSHLLGIQVAVALLTQLSILYSGSGNAWWQFKLLGAIIHFYPYSGESFIVAPWMEFAGLLLLIGSLALYYVIVRPLVSEREQPVGTLLHLLLGLIIVGIVHVGYLFALNAITLIPAQIIMLYCLPLSLLIFAIMIKQSAWVRAFTASYHLIAYPLIGISGLLMVTKFFNAPTGLWGFYLPILNPLELGIIVSGVMIGYYLMHTSNLVKSKSMETLGRADHRYLIGIYGALLVVVTMSMMRTLSFYLDIPWHLLDLWRNDYLQAGLSLLWTLAGIGAILRSQVSRHYESWLAGAILIGIVVLKLFLVDITNSGTLTRGILFIVIALLLIGVGYFAPMPPVRKRQETNISDD